MNRRGCKGDVPSTLTLHQGPNTMDQKLYQVSLDKLHLSFLPGRGWVWPKKEELLFAMLH